MGAQRDAPAKAARETGSASDSRPDPERLGHFRIVGRLGHGGMGVVYRAVDEKLHRDVALKLLTTGIGDDDDRRRRFEREARAVAALSHPNIVAVHSVDQVEGQAFLVMELVQGRTVADVIPRGGMDPLRLLDVAMPLIAAVAAAHDQGIVHRDLKPANVMVTDEGAIKVLDFGLAKLAERPGGPVGMAAPTMTGEGRILGTPAYMSPEQAEGRAVDARSDVFSLGVMLYEMAVGELPFVGGSTISLISSVLRDDPTPIHEKKASIPPQLWRIVRRCLQKEPRKRYQSSRDLLNDLEELKGDLSTGALAPTLPPGPRVPSKPPAARRRKRALGLAAGAIGLSLCSALVGARVGRLSAAPAASAAPQALGGESSAPRFTKLTRLTATSSFKGMPAIAPDGKWMAYSMRAGGKADIYRQRIGGTNPTNLTAGSDSDDDQPAISPDGETIAFHSTRDGGGIYVMGATGENARRLTDFGYTPSWSPDGRQVVVSSVAVRQPLSRLIHGELYIVDVATSARRRLETGEDSSLPAFSPDGKFVAYHYWDGFLERGVAVVPVTGGKPVHVVRGLATWTPAWSPDGKYLYASVVRREDTNLWRVPFDEGKVAFGEPEPVTSGVGFELAYPSLSADGRKLLAVGIHVTSNLARARFDARRARLDGPIEPLTRGSHRFGDIGISPDGNWMVFASGGYEGFASPQEDLFVARTDGSELRQLTDDAPYDRSPRFSGDGKRIFFFSQRGEVTGPGQWSISRDSLRIWSIAPDGSGMSLAFAAPGKRLFVPIPNPVDSRVAAIEWDKAILFDASRPPDQAFLEELPDVHPGAYFYPVSWSADGKTLYGSDLDTAQGEPTGTYSLDVASHTYRRLGPPDDQVTPLRDGRRLLYTWTQRLSVLDTADGSSRLLVDVAPDAIDSFALSRDERWAYLSLVSVDADLWLAEPE